ncbi:Protein of unknown function [Chitinophaga sp. CF118]|uniref:DUF1524 domain-containing protein n=1 Tax=Chitinophaga sp. CF118 TaxID=1884367 RepID=UPI0008E6EE00|nr:DUF1524 domain-containing protein [Chitinophaga sp. CF118]SFE49532.1 Protein of unknown function [Chitinophaga sp. CF118]
MYALSNLNFQDNYRRTRIVLLLFNILSYEELLPEVKFPFWRYNQDIWSIEHIHPQNPRELKSAEEIKSWLTEQEKLLREDKSLNDLVVSLLEEAKNFEAVAVPQEYRSRLQELSERITVDLGLHGIGNLTLLDICTNSSLGNKGFLSKRSAILNKEIEEGVFVPLVTRNVFVKYYTKDLESIPMEFWSRKDAEDYENAIAVMLESYLPKPVSHEK